MDDINYFGNTSPPQDIYGISYDETTNTDGSVSFLGAKMKMLQNGYIDVSVFDKTAGRNSSIIRYSHATSNSPSKQSNGIFFSQSI